MQSLNIKRISVNDSSAIFKKITNILEQHSDKFSLSQKINNGAELKKWIENEHNLSFGIFLNEELIGFINFTVKSDCLYIEQIAIEKNKILNKKGTLLLGFVKTYSEGKPLELKVVNHNIAALNFFVNHGFRFVEYIKNESSYKMRLNTYTTLR